MKNCLPQATEKKKEEKKESINSGKQAACDNTQPLAMQNSFVSVDGLSTQAQILL